MRYFILAGEASGDNLGAMLVEQIKLQDSSASFAFWGGDALASELGIAPLKHIRELAFMGFAEVAANIFTILGLIKRAKRDVSAFKPDVLVCIDYPGFNLRLGKWAKAQGHRVVQYVSPQIWAWRQGRVHKVIASSHRVMCILPFEQEFYARYGYTVDYVGNPLPRRIDQFQAQDSLQVAGFAGEEYVSEPILALLPGSRKQEVSVLLPLMLEAVTLLRANGSSLRPVVAASPALSDELLMQLSLKHQVSWSRSSYEVLAKAELACVASGTATLETALFNVPQVVCYRAGKLSVAIARRLIKVPYIALANLILDKPTIPELIQADCAPENISSTLRQLYSGPERNAQQADYAKLRQLLTPYEASAAAATLVLSEARVGTTS